MHTTGQAAVAWGFIHTTVLYNVCRVCVYMHAYSHPSVNTDCMRACSFQKVLAINVPSPHQAFHL